MKKLILAMTIAFFASQMLVSQENKLALLIGNTSYAYLNSVNASLNNTQNLSQSLQNIGFQTTTLLNQKWDEMDKVIKEFGEKIKKPNTIVFIYYSGYSVSLNGKNYLVPSDADLGAVQDILHEGLDIDIILSKIKQANPLYSFLVFDSAYELQIPGASKVANGLVQPTVQLENSTLIINSDLGTSISPNSQNSFSLAKAIQDNISKIDTNIITLIKRIRASISNYSSGSQSIYADVRGGSEVYLAGKTGQVAVATQSPSPSASSAPLNGTPNLVINPDALLQPVTKNGWVQLSGDWSTVSGGIPKDNNPDKFFFWAAKSAKGELYQDLSLAPYFDQIAEGGQNFKFAIELSSYSQDNDSSSVVLDILDSNGRVLDSFKIPDTNVDTWTPFALTGKLAPTAATARVRLISTRTKGDNNDGYFRRVNFTIPTYQVGKVVSPRPTAEPLVKLPTVNANLSKILAKDVPANRTIEIKTQYGYAGMQGELSSIDVNLQNVYLDAYSYNGQKGEDIRFEFTGSSLKMKTLIMLRAPSGKIFPFYGEKYRFEGQAKLEENGKYQIFVSTGQNWELGNYSLLFFGASRNDIAGELSFEDEHDPENFGNRQDSITIDSLVSVFYKVEISSDDLKPRLVVFDAQNNPIETTKNEGDKRSSYEFLSMGNKLKLVFRNAGMFPFGKYTYKITITGIGK